MNVAPILNEGKDPTSDNVIDLARKDRHDEVETWRKGIRGAAALQALDSGDLKEAAAYREQRL